MPAKRYRLLGLQCPLTPDIACIALNDGLCCHSNSPTECAYESMCIAHESLMGDWALGVIEPARRDNDFVPRVVCEHPAHEPYRADLAEWLTNGYQHREATSDQLRRLWAHHYNDVCPAWPFSEAHAELRMAELQSKG